MKQADLDLIQLIDKRDQKRPFYGAREIAFYGARKIAFVVSRSGHPVGGKRVPRLIRLMGEAGQMLQQA